MIDLKNFWGANFYNNPPLTDEALAEAEASLDVRLPAEFVDLLRIQNGGYTQRFAHPMAQETSWAPDHVPLDALAGIVTGSIHDSMHNILLTEYLTQEWELPPRQVLLAGGGAYWITLDYRRGPIPTVAWIDVDCDQDMQVAESFAAFLSGLVPASAYDD